MLPALDWVDALGATTVALALMFSMPQLLRLVRTGNAAGLSLTALGNSGVSTVAWFGYGLHLGDPWVVTSTAVYAPTLVVTAWYAWRAGADRSTPWLPLAWTALLLAGLAIEASTLVPAFALVLGGSTLWLVGPAVLTAWTSEDISGIAPGTWWVLLGEGVIFLAYGLMAGVFATVVYAVVCFLGATGVLSRLAVDHYDLDVNLPVRDADALDLAA